MDHVVVEQFCILSVVVVTKIYECNKNTQHYISPCPHSHKCVHVISSVKCTPMSVSQFWCRTVVIHYATAGKTGRSMQRISLYLVVLVCFFCNLQWNYTHIITKCFKKVLKMLFYIIWSTLYTSVYLSFKTFSFGQNYLSWFCRNK